MTDNLSRFRCQLVMVVTEGVTGPSCFLRIILGGWAGLHPSESLTS